MKLLVTLYLHYVQVVFPMLAQEYNWSIQFDPQFRRVVCRHVGAGRTMNRKQLQQAVSFCRKIASKPQLMHEVV